VLLAVGREPRIENLGLEELGIQIENKRIVIDKYCRTNLKNIFAAGDCASALQLAHFAQHQASIAVENMFSPQTPLPFETQNIPNCIFTDPEISNVGLQEKDAQAKKIDYGIEKIDFLACAMARIIDEPEGFLKIIYDKHSDSILGACLIGPRASELIATLNLAIACGLKRKELSRIIFAHPTISETIVQAPRKDIYGF